jgi:hypothetical protein
MASAVEIAVDAYIRIFSEPDPAKRNELIAACFAPDGRIVTRSREIRGQAGVAEMANRFFADPEMLGVRVVAVDATNTTFRFRALTELRDGTTLEVNDAGEIDATGRISVILTFAGPLEECATSRGYREPD